MLGGGGQNVHGDQSLLVAAEELRFLSPLCSGNLLGCVHALLKVSTIDCCCPCKRAAPAYNIRFRRIKTICLPYQFAPITSSRAAVFGSGQKLTSTRCQSELLRSEERRVGKE